jgi:hypothetical protein
MGINGKYSTGIILTFVLLVAAMLYVFPALHDYRSARNYGTQFFS